MTHGHDSTLRSSHICYGRAPQRQCAWHKPRLTGFVFPIYIPLSQYACDVPHVLEEQKVAFCLNKLKKGVQQEHADVPTYITARKFNSDKWLLVFPPRVL